jgi:ribonuclease BN (tRNA processing enzyme)
MRLTILGSGGWYPTLGRETASALLRQGDRALLIDAGTGVSNLHRWSLLIQGVRSWSVVLTHFHLDHLAGLEWLKALPVPQPKIYGPGAWLYDRTTNDFLSQFRTFLPTGVSNSDLAQEIIELEPGAAEIEGFPVRLRAQEFHSDPTVALRVADHFALCTDTALDFGNTEFASGVSCLLHEAGAENSGSSTHSSGAEAAEVARAAGADELLLIHRSPGSNAGKILRDAEAIVPESSWAHDGVVRRFPS